MSEVTEPRVCKRCGEEIADTFPNLRTISVLKKTPKIEHLSKLMALEQLSLEAAEQWLLHEYYVRCPEKVSYCPHCGEKLSTWRAQQCLSCHRQWHKKSS